MLHVHTVINLQDLDDNMYSAVFVSRGILPSPL
jgi:hypothetical protein